MLSDIDKRTILDFIQLIESSLRWPSHQQRVLYFLILKLNGKDRLIGLLPSLIRIWEILRYGIKVLRITIVLIH